MPKQLWITRTNEIDAAISDARQLWPVLARDGQLAGQVILHWHNGRQHDGRKAAQERTELLLSEVLDRLAAIEERLGMEGNDHDTDHA